MLTLYFTPGTSSMAPHIALHEIGVPFEAHAMAPNEHREAAYRALNPEGKVPTLTVDGRPMTEVARDPLLPGPVLPRGEPAAGRRYRGAGPGDFLDVLPRRHRSPCPAAGPGPCPRHICIGERPTGARWAWALGDDYSIADIHLFRLFWRFNGSLSPPREEFPNLIAHHDRMKQRPAVRKTIEIESAIGYRLPA